MVNQAGLHGWAGGWAGTSAIQGTSWAVTSESEAHWRCGAAAPGGLAASCRQTLPRSGPGILQGGELTAPPLSVPGFQRAHRQAKARLLQKRQGQPGSSARQQADCVRRQLARWRLPVLPRTPAYSCRIACRTVPAAVDGSAAAKASQAGSSRPGAPSPSPG